MFDYFRTYQKGACVVHMIRSLLGEDDFKKSLKEYFSSFNHRTAETDDLRKIFEQNSGVSLSKFFDQWLYQSGHPELNIEFSINNQTLKINIEQVQSNEFEFPLEIIVILAMEDGSEKRIEDVLFLSNKQMEKEYAIPNGATIKRHVIDPYLKILKKINIVNPNPNKSILLNSLENGETIIEKIQAARALKNNSSSESITPLKKIILQQDIPWSVRVETVKTTESIKSDESYKSLEEILISINNNSNNNNNKVKEAVIQALGSFSKNGTFDLLKPIIENDTESDSVLSAAAIAISKSGKEEVLPVLAHLLEKKSYKSIVAKGAIEGLKITAIESGSSKKVDYIVSMLHEKCKVEEDPLIRQKAISVPGIYC